MEVRIQLIGIRELLFGNGQARSDDVLRVEARVYLLHLEEASNEQSGAGEEQERERNFRHNERRPQAMFSGAGAGATAAFLHAIRERLGRVA